MKTIYAEAQPGKVVLKEKEIPAPGKGEVLLKAKYRRNEVREQRTDFLVNTSYRFQQVSDMRWQQKSLRLAKVWRT